MAEGGFLPEEDEVSENNEVEEFQDALESLPESSVPDLQSSIDDAISALDLFLNNDFDTAKVRFQKWADRSMYHALGYGTIMYLQAAMTFERTDINAAVEVVKHSTEVCNRFRRKLGFMDSLYRQKNNYNDLSAEEAHAELCYAECLLERAFLTFIQDENLINFIRGTLRVKTCYNSYKECVRILSKRNWKDCDGRIHFESGVCLGVGAFNLMISLMPSRILKALEFVGFSGDKWKGLQQLEQGAMLSSSMRGSLCAFSLIAYHVIITYVLGTGEGDVELADGLLKQLLVRYPNGAFILFYAGRLNEVKGNISNAIIKFEESIDSQQLWQQLHHFCYWELMWCHCFKGDWLLAMKYAERLLAESKWSKATYAYQKAAFLLMCDDQTESTNLHISHLLEQVPKLKQRIAGKSLPIEKFAVKKSELFFEQGRRLTLPAYELIYIWNGFLILSKSSELLDPILLRAEACLQEITSDKVKFVHYGDDYCLALLIKGVCLKHKGEMGPAENCFQYIIRHDKEIRVDKYLIPSALYELAMLYITMNRPEQAEDALSKARHNYKGYSLESRIQFRLHAALMKVNSMRELNDRKGSAKALNHHDPPALSQ